MTARTTRDYLLALKETIAKERQQAIQLDIQGMCATMQKKEELLEILAHIKEIDEQDQPLAAQIRHENRRNAFLFKTTLKWIRETMEFFGKRTVPSTYSSNAATVDSNINGRLLSGKV